MKLSVLMPVYDEATTLREIVDAVLAMEGADPIESLEIVAVDDGSDDGSWAILEELAGEDDRIRILRHERNLGKGAALRSALSIARGEFSVVQDADLECRPEDLPALLAPLDRGEAQVVFGSRFAPHGPPPGTGFHQIWFNRLLSAMFRRATGMGLSDVAVCYKAFPTELVRAMKLASQGFTIDTEMAIKFARQGIAIAEVPITYRPRSHAEGKKMKILHGCRALATMAIYWLFGFDASG